MRIDPLYMAFAIPRPKRPQHQIGAFRNRKLSQAENASVFSIPVAYTHMVGMMGTIKPRFFSLFRREKATLAFRNGKKPGFGFLGRALHD